MELWRTPHKTARGTEQGEWPCGELFLVTHLISWQVEVSFLDQSQNEVYTFNYNIC